MMEDSSVYATASDFSWLFPRILNGIGACVNFARPTLIAAVFGLTTFPAYSQTFRASLSEDYTIASDRTVTVRSHREYTPLVRSIVQPLSQISLPINGNQTFELVDAYTKKANGDIVKVEPSDLVVQKGAVGQAQSFVDVTIHQISFRSVTPGDTVVLDTKYVEKDHYIPANYSKYIGAYSSNSHLEYDIKVHVSDGVPFYYSSDSGFHLQQTRTEGARTYNWTGQFDLGAASEKNRANLRDSTPSIYFGTFKNFEELGNVYANAISDRLKVTPEIQKLADQITTGKTSARDKVQAVFDWTSSHIHYVGIYFGSGGYIPNEPSTIIARGFGDCKDHAILMNVLLAAVGIESQEVLITQEPSYTLPPTAIVGAFNHLIVYVPSLDLFADPTDPYSNLGALPDVDAGKPVLLVSKGKSKVASTPKVGTDGNTAKIDTRIDLDADLVATGITTTEATGEFAELLRQFTAKYEMAGEDQAISAITDNGGYNSHPTDVSIEAPSSLDHRQLYKVVVKWKSDGPVRLLKDGWLPPAGMTPLNVQRDSFVPVSQDEKRKFPVTCRPGQLTLDGTVNLPAGIKPKYIAPPISFVSPLMKYFSGWMYADNTMTRHISIIAETPGRYCSAADANALIDAARSVSNREDIIFRFSRED